MRRKRSLHRTMVRGSILLFFESKERGERERERSNFFKSQQTCDQLQHETQVCACGFDKN